MPERPLSIDIRQPLLVKDAELFLVSEQDGHVPREWAGFGLFYRDCCYFSRYELSLDGSRPLLLMSAWEEGFTADIELTNPGLEAANGKPIPMHSLGIKRRLHVLGRECALVDVITLHNFSSEEFELPLALTLTVGFESIFVVRGMAPGRRGTLRTPQWKHRHVRFSELGADEITRTLDVSFSIAPIVAPRTSEETVASFDMLLRPRESRELIACFRPRETPTRAAPPARPRSAPSLRKLEARRTSTSRRWLEGFTRAGSSDEALDAVLRRSLSDLRLLRLDREGCEFPAAGVPWFVGLFGRDTLIPALQCLAFDPDIAAHAARLLARWQGKEHDARRHEEPGKILHELRVGEMAHLGEVPQTPSYASVDATLLFVILIARHAAWSGSLALFRELRANVERALDWMVECGDRNGDGYIEYYGRTEHGGPVNQGWKDSEDGIVRRDGSYPEPPISLVEVQGYAWLALTEIAELYRRAGEAGTAAALTGRAQALRERFNRDFWMPEQNCYCLALEGDGRQVSVVSSNAGQALWSGIADPDRARRTAERLFEDDMFSGWGVRTLSSREARYNPLAYQQGSIWPFDNSLILAGLRRCGRDDLACLLFRATLDAAIRFPHGRLPEFFAGTSRQPGFSPARCPRADPLQAWSAGTIPYMLIELLGLRPEGFESTLRIVRPRLPEPIRQVELRGLRVGAGSVDLRFEREAGIDVTAQVLAVTGKLRIEVERVESTRSLEIGAGDAGQN